MNGFRPVGKFVALKAEFGGQKTTEAGIIYTEKVNSRLVWSRVVAVGDDVTEDIKVGDKALWDITKVRGNHFKEFDLIHQEHIYMVERE